MKRTLRVEYCEFTVIGTVVVCPLCGVRVDGTYGQEQHSCSKEMEKAAPLRGRKKDCPLKPGDGFGRGKKGKG